MNRTGIELISVACILLLVAIHILTPKLSFLDGLPRSRWLSFAGGVSVAYVFVHLLPELAESQDVLSEAVGEGLSVVENHVYILALIGLGAFYGVERFVSGPSTTNGQTDASSRHGSSSESTEVAIDKRAEEEHETGPKVFWVNVASFALYNVLIGYLLLHRIRISGRLEGLVLFTFAMALHFVVTDHGLIEHDKGGYLRIGRWALAAAALVGWLIALFTEVPEAVVAILTALLAGGVILNVLKEELPRERQSRFSAFAVGAIVYTVILLAL